MTTHTIKHLGAEFHRAADSLADTLARLDNARLERLTFLRQCSKDSTVRLAAIKEELRTLPEQIAKWDAEAARLESQTAEDLLRQALEPVRAEKPTEERGPVFGPEDHERCHCCKGLFLKPVEYHHTSEECAFLVTQVELGAVVLPPQPSGEVVEAMADEAEKPTLLDLTKLPPGTEVQLMEACNTSSGSRLVLGQKVKIAGVGVTENDGSTWVIPALVPARVVREGGEQ